MNVPKNLLGCRGLRMNIRQGCCLDGLRVSRRMGCGCQAGVLALVEFALLILR